MKCVQILAQRDVDLNSRDNKGNTPLHLSAQNGHLEVVKCLLNHGAKINPRRETSFLTPLHLATMNNHIKVVEYLVYQSKELIDEIEVTGRTACHLACSYHHTTSLDDYGGEEEEDSQQSLAVLDVLMSNGADVNRKDNDGITPLQIACKHGNLQIIKKLLQEAKHDDAMTKIHLYSRSRFGNTALDISLINKRYKCAEYLAKARKRFAIVEENERQRKRELEIKLRVEEEARLAVEMKKLNELREEQRRTEEEKAQEIKRREAEERKERELWGKMLA